MIIPLHNVKIQETRFKQISRTKVQLSINGQWDSTSIFDQMQLLTQTSMLKKFHKLGNKIKQVCIEE